MVEHMTIYIVLAFLSTWLLILSYIIYRTREHYLSLTNHTKKHRIDDVLDKLVDNDEKMSADLEKIKKSVVSITDESKIYFQKLGLIRFNPFGRTGGEQSFVLALLDKNNTGLVINFIYTHEGIRVYTKRIKEGKGEEYSLSDEEKEAVLKAK